MTNKPQTSCAEQRAQPSTELACIPGQVALPVWRASVRMALVSAAGMVAAGLIATGMAGCADVSGIASQASLRDAASLGLGTAAAQAKSPVAAEWWRDFGDETLNSLVARALESSPNLKLAQARLARAGRHRSGERRHAAASQWPA